MSADRKPTVSPGPREPELWDRAKERVVLVTESLAAEIREQVKERQS